MASTRELPRRIKPLDVAVVNRIAAGEIIVQPANALKEMLENSIDAGSSAIDIVAKDGGLKLLQITDNGTGIRRDDLPILCERFTTSKLQTFDDLNALATYGFRGEALASISHIAHLTVTTRTRDSDCAWRAGYADGKLVTKAGSNGSATAPKPVAGRQGTQILVEDLFFNVPSRLRAFRSPADEYNKIVDIVGRYGVHSAGIGFTCKKHGDAHPSLIIPAQASTIDRIRIVFGSVVASELTEVNTQENRKLGFLGASGWVSNANYNSKKSAQPVFFINHRLVSCDPLKRALAALYTAFLPKGAHAFMYMSLHIAPDKLDVNVHPTKREVRFLNEDEIVALVCDSVQDALGRVDSSRNFKTQSVLVGGGAPIEASGEPVASGGKKRVYEYNLVRTDAKERKITAMFESKRVKRAPAPADAKASMPDTIDVLRREPELIPENYELVDRDRVAIKLDSIKNLRELVKKDLHRGLTEVFADHTFVGVVDESKRLACIQHGVKLFLVDYGAVSFELFYQIGLSDFGNFGFIRLVTPLSIRELLRLVFETDDGSMHTLTPEQENDIEVMTNQLITMRAMLMEYFSMDISEKGDLQTLPMLLKGYIPPIAKLPEFIYRACKNVDYTRESECFKSFLRELAIFYVPEPLPLPLPGSTPPLFADETGESIQQTSSTVLEQRRTDLQKSIEHFIFPSVARRLIGAKSLLNAVVEIANLPGLYKIFERC
ncbi:histidine kinase-like ATPase [Limtongia smithiae]|uniref:histidine kinase-like ATPase n=1 Tax=Limtongia smithiae TaxID=1125753 RepID=UPI0034CF22C2